MLMPAASDRGSQPYSSPLGSAKWLVGKPKKKKHAVGMLQPPVFVAYLKAGILAEVSRIPAISPYLQHGCMAGYLYQAPLGLYGGCLLAEGGYLSTGVGFLKFGGGYL